MNNYEIKYEEEIDFIDTPIRNWKVLVVKDKETGKTHKILWDFNNDRAILTLE